MAKRYELEWEEVDDDRFTSWRASVPGGWLVLVDHGSMASLTFMPDPEHAWAAAA